MITLLIDVVSNNSIIALISDENHKTIEKINFDHNQLHSETIVPALESLINESPFSYLDIKKVVCVIGPGNYTNIRTGLAVAKGISLVNNIDAHGITQHELIAQTYQYSAISGTIVVITHSTKNNYYYKEFNSILPNQDDPILLHADEVLNKIDKSKTNIIETGNEFLSYLIKNNLDIKNLTSNYIIPNSNLGKICELKSSITDNIKAKYIKVPNFVKYKKRDIYE
jgi:tRNA threonylcarbamoyl adenosine modification protein YeaZ